VATDLTAALVVTPYRRRRTVLVVRHPLDVLVSSFHYAQRRFDGDLNAFADDPVWGIEKVVRFLDLWAREAADDPDVLLCRYEDLLAAPRSQLERVARFCGMPRHDHAIDVAVERGRFDAMKAMQDAGIDPVLPSSGVRILSGGEDLGLGPKVRRGSSGQWRDELAPEVAERLAAVVQARVDPWYGYSA
jgi:alcohol sulfotransferase